MKYNNSVAVGSNELNCEIYRPRPCVSIAVRVLTTDSMRQRNQLGQSQNNTNRHFWLPHLTGHNERFIIQIVKKYGLISFPFRLHTQHPRQASTVTVQASQRGDKVRSGPPPPRAAPLPPHLFPQHLTPTLHPRSVTLPANRHAPRHCCKPFHSCRILVEPANHGAGGSFQGSAIGTRLQYMIQRTQLA